MVPKVKGNPLYISVFLLVISYFFGEFIIPKYKLLLILNILGLAGLIISIFIFVSAINLFFSYNEKLHPKTKTIRIIKTGIFAYTRNPIYLSFVLFHFSMFLVFENVMYFISSIGIFFWINNYVIFEEEKYLKNKFDKEFNRYSSEVKRWLIF